jgi:hypothetical protein
MVLGLVLGVVVGLALAAANKADRLGYLLLAGTTTKNGK